MKYEAISSFLFRSFLLLLAVLVILSKIHWLYFFIAQFIAGLIRLIYVVWQSNRLVRPALKIDFHLMRTIFLQALPIGFALLLTQGYLRIDVILLKQLANYREVAYFFYPYRILFELNIIPLALTTALFPVLARAAKSKSGSGINEIENLFIPAFKYYLILSLPIMIFGYLYAMPIMTTFFTEKFRESGPCLQIMIWATFFVFVEVLMSLSLIATGRQRILFFANGACLTTNFLVDYILIQYFHLGAIGASIGTVSAYTVLFLILFYRIRETVSLRKVIHQIPRPLIAGLICGIIFYYFRTFSWYYMIPIGFIVYILLLFILRTFNQKEIQMLRDLVRPPGAVET